MSSSFDGGGSRINQGASAAIPAESSKLPHLSDEEAATWAGLLVGTMTPQPEAAQVGLGLPGSHQAAAAEANSGAETNAFRAGSQTAAGGVTQSQTADTAGVNATGPDRLILNVDSETLGRVQLVVDRDEGGVRVVVGSDPGARSRLSEGKHALSEALSAAGVRVNSLRIVAANEVGTVLAQDLMSKKSRPESERKAAEQKERDKSSKGKRHNLNLVG